MRHRLRKRIIISMPFLFLAVFAVYWFRQPRFEGRLLSSIFRDYCLITFGQPYGERYLDAADAFTRMNSNAVPFLVFQLTNTVPTMADSVFAKAQNVPVLSNYVKHVPASKKRGYAARALGLMGTNAEQSAPILISMWLHQSPNSLSGEIVGALEGVLKGPHYAWYQRHADWKEYEASVMTYARERYPSLFPSTYVFDPRARPNPPPPTFKLRNPSNAPSNSPPAAR